MKKLLLILATVATVLVSPAYATGGKGMTWVKALHDANFGIDRVACVNCNAYQGDTSCKTSLPVLCIRVDNSPRPPYIALPTTGVVGNPEFYDGWAGGHLTTTTPVLGTTLTSAATGDKLCATSFGAGWRMAEFHDNRVGGWGLRAYGNIRDDTNFWVKINDQPANCWNP